jgi:uncharacterized protein (DUF305 family)
MAVALLFLGGAATYFSLAKLNAPPPKDSVDAGFLYDMISHHEQAIRLATIELANGTEPDVQVFAREILVFQSYEIGLMDRRLADWGLQRQNRPPRAMGWMSMPVDPSAMPGMATEEEIADLRASTGRDADARFLRLMKTHHLGGTHLAA